MPIEYQIEKADKTSDHNICDTLSKMNFPTHLSDIVYTAPHIHLSAKKIHCFKHKGVHSGTHVIYKHILLFNHLDIHYTLYWCAHTDYSNRNDGNQIPCRVQDTLRRIYLAIITEA